MSERDRHDRGAILALGLILGTIVILAGLSALGELFSQLVAPISPGNEQQHYEDADYHIWGDSWAQWAMSAFAVIATGVSWRGLYLLRRTFEETKRTADAALEAHRTAREIGEAGTRAYVVCLTCTLVNFYVGDRPAAKVQFKNIGSTPAANITVRGNIVCGAYPQRAESINRSLTSDATSTFGLAPETLPVTTYINRMKVFTQDESDAISAGKKALYVYVRIDYEDVFGRDNVSSIMFMYNRDDAQGHDDDSLPIAPFGNSFEWGKHKT